jgi:hypothetical protein
VLISSHKSLAMRLAEGLSASADEGTISWMVP